MPPSDTEDWNTASEAVNQSTASADDARNTTPKNDQDVAKKRDTAGETATANAEPSERPAKKMKRGKYISRACVREEIHADNVSRNNFLANRLLQEADNRAVATQGQAPLEVKTKVITTQATATSTMKF
ncbi:hypothetical protein NW762_011091 [Fusarium torreyae]|uniref:Uncharacterized protein n=1 Tax=Fusarium torreyae TaxID=1237075 RepID=A0A9W8RUM2_9HYPO|nr:hypothetical protein NW762_011091 [Fusarium torreyae]